MSPKAATDRGGDVGWTFSLREAWVWTALASTAALVLAAVSHLRLYEFDPIMFTRAGAEFLATGQVQTRNTWTSTAFGQPWYNLQLIPSIVFQLVASLREPYFFLPTLRAFLVLLFIGGLLALLRRAVPKGAAGWGVALLTTAIVFAISDWRLVQLRGESFVLPLFVALVLLWNGATRAGALSRALVGLGLLVVWANTHGGTFLLGAFVQLTGLALVSATGSLSGRARLLLAAASLAAWFATPVGVHVLGLFFTIASIEGYAGNPDNGPFTWGQLSFAAHGLFAFKGNLWVAFTVASLWSLKGSRDGLLPLYRNRGLTLATAVLLTAASLCRYRLVTYQMVYLAPLFALTLARVARKAAPWAFGFGCAFFAVTATLEALGTPPKGFGLKPDTFPVGSVAYLRANHPLPKLFVGDRYYIGGYLVAELPEYPVSLDGRTELFTEEMKAIGRAKTPAALEAYLAAHDYNIALLDPAAEHAVAEYALYRRESWALVYFEPRGAVLVRRRPENAALIARDELARSRFRGYGGQ